ncbi:MAG: redoxin domain-containing protein [Chitinophagaceae bacterium]|nr:redoxin domain-containing protein [Chitinophagaceae bacterium]
MKKTFLLLFATILIARTYSQVYSITVQYKPATGSFLYLGYYFGDKKYVQDSAVIDNDGTAIFKGEKPLVGGLYILVDEKKQRFFDLLIDKEQHIELSIDTSDFSLKSVKGSSDNNYLDAYKKATSDFFRNYNQWQNDLKSAKTKTDSIAIEKKMNLAAERSQHWRDSFTLVHPDSYLALLFRLMKEPVYTVGGKKTKQDTLNAYINYKKQYWQDITLSDERLLRTPMFEQRLTRYFENVVIRHPDSIKYETDKFILYSRSNTTMFRYFINRFTNEYMNPKYMGMDVVFLHLFEKYYLTNQVTWLEPKDKDLVFNRAYSLMGNVLGEPAAELNMLDTLDKKVNLYSIKAPYTLVVFWDPDCGHCKETVPVIDSMYKNFWQKTGMQLVGVLVDTVRTAKNKLPEVKKHWMEFIHEKNLLGWNHWYQAFEAREEEKRNNLPGFRQNYDVYQTPTIYLLDKDKRIVAKKISPEQINDFLKHQQTKNNP